MFSRISSSSRTVPVASHLVAASLSSGSAVEGLGLASLCNNMQHAQQQQGTRGLSWTTRVLLDTDNDKTQPTADNADADADNAQDNAQGEGVTKTGHPQLDEAHEHIAALEEQIKELQETNLRRLADMETVRRVAREDVARAKEFGISALTKDLLEVADNFERAVGSVYDNGILDKPNVDPMVTALHEGNLMNQRELLNVLNKHGVEQMGDPTNHQFDPNIHEALFEVPTADTEPGIVAAVVKRGYTLNTRVLRPAQVGVTKALE